MSEQFPQIEVPGMGKTERSMISTVRPFMPAEILFPKWRMATVMLDHFVRLVNPGEMKVLTNPRDWPEDFPPNCLQIGIEYPRVRDELTGEMVPMVEIFPPEDRELVKYICNTVHWDYAHPELRRRLIGRKIETDSIEYANVMLRQWELSVISQGGRSAYQELAFRLGIWL